MMIRVRYTEPLRNVMLIKIILIEMVMDIHFVKYEHEHIEESKSEINFLPVMVKKGRLVLL